MSMEAQRQWVCDRCGHSTTTSMQDQPPQWGFVDMARPPLMDANGVQRLHLCGRCFTRVDEVIKYPTTSDASGSPQEPKP